jgi:hypothetical protein
VGVGRFVNPSQRYAALVASGVNGPAVATLAFSGDGVAAVGNAAAGSGTVSLVLSGACIGYPTARGEYMLTLSPVGIGSIRFGTSAARMFILPAMVGNGGAVGTSASNILAAFAAGGIPVTGYAAAQLAIVSVVDEEPPEEVGTVSGTVTATLSVVPAGIGEATPAARIAAIFTPVGAGSGLICESGAVNGIIRPVVTGTGSRGAIGQGAGNVRLTATCQAARGNAAYGAGETHISGAGTAMRAVVGTSYGTMHLLGDGHGGGPLPVSPYADADADVAFVFTEQRPIAVFQ